LSSQVSRGSAESGHLEKKNNRFENLQTIFSLTKRKTWENRDPEKIQKKPRGPSHWRDVVRVECGAASRKKGQSRPQNEKPLGGYPDKKVNFYY